MADRINISIDDLTETITNELELYNKEVIEGVKKATLTAATTFTKLTKKDAPKSDSKRKGTFARNISFKKTRDGTTGDSYLWYVKDPEHRLTHLLKNGHATRKGGRTTPQDFITNNYNQVEEKYLEDVEEVIKNER